MYNPPAFREADLALQHQFMRERRFGLVVSGGAGLMATSLPLLLDTAVAPLGVLSGHVSKANDHWKTLDGADVLVVYQGPDAYVTPSWYPSKAEHGTVVPTWNYVMVQVRGTARVMHDADWLHRHVTALTEVHEQSRDEPWHVSDAPSSYIAAQIRGIVGVEIAIREIDGKRKVSQNRAVADRLGVADGLARDGHSDMADLVRARAT
ncbi:MAG TPA: FMN-binding negative transcriptional regulator [Luteitalea sp.]|nr:FMN-binding negative transcriptional regulator [Luteitalea sp.]